MTDLPTYVREQLTAGKAVDLSVDAPEGSTRLLLIPSQCYDGAEQEILIALEGWGCLMYKPGMVLNVFTFLMCNFPVYAASKILELLNAAFPPAGAALPVCRVRRLTTA